MPNDDDEFRDDPEFMEWLSGFLPDWEMEYSGDIYGMWVAFNAGKKTECLKSS